MKSSRGLLLFLVFTFFVCLPAEVLAVDFTVNLTSDQQDANFTDGNCDVDPVTPGSQCTLRAAIEEANFQPSNDRVLFNLPADSTITLTVANGGEIVIFPNGSLEIVGPGANTLTIDGGAGDNRIFYSHIANINISGVTLTGGNGGGNIAGLGGAVLANGGSGIFHSVHVTGNTATISGGGLFLTGGTFQIINSAFSANTSVNGGAITNLCFLFMANSTISGNTATNAGGAISTVHPGGLRTVNLTVLRNVTITNNTAVTGGGIVNTWVLDIGNTIVAGNTATGGVGPEILNQGAVTSVGGNLVGDSAGDSANTLLPIVYHPTDVLDVNPVLGPLQNNGGPTPTHALRPESPAIDRGLNPNAINPATGAPLTTDQRGPGFPRIRDGNGDGSAIVDIGAYEFFALGTTAADVRVSGRVRTESGRGIGGAVVSVTDSDGNVRYARTSSFGYYVFDELEAGETYIFSVSAKRYKFPSRVVVLNDELTDLDFVPEM